MKKFRKFMAAMTVAATLCIPGCPIFPCDGGEEIECEDCNSQIFQTEDQSQTLATLEEQIG